MVSGKNNDTNTGSYDSSAVLLKLESFDFAAWQYAEMLPHPFRLSWCLCGISSTCEQATPIYACLEEKSADCTHFAIKVVSMPEAKIHGVGKHFVLGYKQKLESN